MYGIWPSEEALLRGDAKLKIVSLARSSLETIFGKNVEVFYRRDDFDRNRNRPGHSAIGLPSGGNLYPPELPDQPWQTIC
jgi:hypothetical protein